jgi:hypothetical protein
MGTFLFSPAFVALSSLVACTVAYATPKQQNAVSASEMSSSHAQPTSDPYQDIRHLFTEETPFVHDERLPTSTAKWDKFFGIVSNVLTTSARILWQPFGYALNNPKQSIIYLLAATAGSGKAAHPQSSSSLDKLFPHTKNTYPQDIRFSFTPPTFTAPKKMTCLDGTKLSRNARRIVRKLRPLNVYATEQYWMHRPPPPNGTSPETLRELHRRLHQGRDEQIKMIACALCPNSCASQPPTNRLTHTTWGERCTESRVIPPIQLVRDENGKDRILCHNGYSLDTVGYHAYKILTSSNRGLSKKQKRLLRKRAKRLACELFKENGGSYLVNDFASTTSAAGFPCTP